MKGLALVFLLLLVAVGSAAPTAKCREVLEDVPLETPDVEGDSWSAPPVPKTGPPSSTEETLSATAETATTTIPPTSPGTKAQSLLVTSSDDTTPRQASWTDHPVYKANPSAVEPPILAWYTTKSANPKRINVRGRYTRQGSQYQLLREGEDADQLKNADLLHFDIHVSIKEDDAPIEFETTRPARMCLVMDVRERSNGGRIHQMYTTTTDFEMDGPEGYNLNLGIAEWDPAVEPPRGAPTSENTYAPPERGYVVCRQQRAGRHTLPGAPNLGAQWTVYVYSVLFMNDDGSVPALSAPPPGWSGPEIKQHEKCPDQLHDMWSVPPPDPNDPDTKGMMFRSWHPQVDYLYRCYYGHEHGSFDGLAGYTSRFDYTAHKNNRQDEFHDGFKNYVIPVGNKFVVVNLHAATNDFDRLQVDLHTMVVAVTDRASGKLLSEMSCKSSSGGTAAEYNAQSRPPNDSDEPSMKPMGDAASQQRTKDMWADGEKRDMVIKRANLFNPNRMDPELLYEGGDMIAHYLGRYEGWFMRALGPYCMSSTNHADSVGPVVDIKNPQNGCMNPGCTDKIILGLKDNIAYPGENGFFPNLGNNRRIFMRGLRIAPDLCDLDLPEPNADGYMVFYTNPTCDALCDGPGPNCVMQRMHSSFDGVSLDETYATNDAHGHFPYEPEGPRGVITGLQGIAQVEGALGVDAEMP